MKNVLIGTLIVTLIVVALADPGDLVIEIVIPAAKLSEFRVGFLEACPIEGDYTEKQWVKKVADDHLRAIYAQGKEQIARKAAAAAYTANYSADPNVL